MGRFTLRCECQVIHLQRETASVSCVIEGPITINRSDGASLCLTRLGELHVPDFLRRTLNFFCATCECRPLVHRTMCRVGVGLIIKSWGGYSQINDQNVSAEDSYT